MLTLIHLEFSSPREDGVVSSQFPAKSVLDRQNDPKREGSHDHPFMADQHQDNKDQPN